MRVEIGTVLLAAAAALAAAAGPALEVSTAVSECRVGDRVAVRVAARGAGDLLWGEPQVTAGDDDRWAVSGGPRRLSGSRPPAWELVLVPMEVGELELPAVEVTVRDGDVSRTVGAGALPSVTVETVLPEAEDPEPAPLRAPLGVGGFPWEWVVPALVPTLVVAAVLAVWGRRIRGGASGGRPAAVPPLNELESLLDRLAGRVGREPCEGLCDQLAYGVRRYLQRQSEQPVMDMTSYEVRQLVRELQWPDDVQRGVPLVMSTADRVRFARRAADQGELRRVLEVARSAARSIEDERLRREAGRTEEAAT